MAGSGADLQDKKTIDTIIPAGMIPMPKAERAKYKSAMSSLPVLTAADLKK